MNNSNREKAFNLYRQSRGKATSKEIAAQLGEKISTIKYWRRSDVWSKRLKGGAPLGNNNAAGNRGGGAPKNNLNGFKHGAYIDNSKLLSKKFLSKYLPKATEKIIEDITESNLNSLEILWSNIMLKFAGILRSQKIMHVKNKNDITKELKKESFGKTDSTEYEIQFAWDKQANFLNVQSKAMRELTNMITQYEKLVHENYDLVNEEHRLRIKLLDSKIPKGTESKEDKIDRYLEALEEAINVK